MRQCVEVGLVKEEDLSVDSTFIEANAAKERRIPSEAISKQPKSTTPYGSIWWNWNSRIR